MMRPALARALIFTYALASTALYCGLLPLWEGFDELYHYGNLQYYSHARAFPTLGSARLSRELWDSLDFAPASHFIQPYFQRPSTSFEEYFRLTPEERRARRAKLEQMDRSLQWKASPRENYEAKQAPLAYVLLAPFDWLLSGAALPARVLGLRLLLAIPSIVLLWAGTRRLARRLALQGAFEAAALFALFSCQMVYATACHIANDALLLPWFVWFLTAVTDFSYWPTARRAGLAGLLMALGLLIKASVLVLVPLLFVPPAVLWYRQQRPRKAVGLAALALAVLLALAGPWYVRNVLLYRNLTATGDTTEGVGPRELLRSAQSIPWQTSAAATAHEMLWTGNSSFTTFSSTTLNLLLIVLASGALLYATRARRNLAESTTLVAIALYTAGLIVIALSFWRATRGETNAPMPWYGPVMLAPIVAICYLGFARWPRPGRWVAALSTVLWAYVAAASWLAKLAPMYSGFREAHAHFRQLWTWYFDASAQRNAILSALCPAPLLSLYFLLVSVLCLLVASGLAAMLSLLRSDAPPFPYETSAGKDR